MGFINNVKRWLSMRLLGKAKEEFDVTVVSHPQTENLINICGQIYRGVPYWLEDGVKTINFAEVICSEIARLTTLGIHITVDGAEQQGSRAYYIQKQIDGCYYRLREWIENGCGYGTIILKPSQDDIQVMTPDRYVSTEEKNDEIWGAVFHSCVQSPDGKKWYNRLEYHRFLENGLYAVDNRCYIGDSRNDAGKPIPIEKTPWNGLQEHVEIEGLERPLFAVFRTPAANNKEINSPLGMPVFAQAIEELKDLDVAYSRNSTEIYDSNRIVLLDSDKLTAGNFIEELKPNSPQTWELKRKQMKLPDYVKNVEGDGSSSFYQEINPTLNTEVRVGGINNYLSQIGFKCGFSNGYFVFNEKTGMITATQVEADDRRTIQTIKDVRDRLESAIKDLCYALDKFADLYDYAPVGEWELVFDFGDITYSYQEDKATWWNYVVQGKAPAWRYFVKFEGMSEDEAKEMIAEAALANAETQQLFARVGNE